MVVFGVVMELLVIRHEYRDDMEAWALAFFGVLRRPARPSAFKVGVEVASVLLITFGIVGELWIGISIASINSVLRGKSVELRSKNAYLRSKSDQLLALVTQQAGKAKDSADSAKASAKVIGEQAKSLQTRVATADLRIEGLRKANNESAANLEEERRKRLKLAASMLDRTGVIQKLAALHTSAPVLFEFLDEREVIRTAEKINFVFSQLRWETLPRTRGHEEAIKDGITISAGTGFPPRSPSDTDGMQQIRERDREVAVTTAICQTLAKSLQASGLDAQCAYAPFRFPPDEILVAVGPKPNHAVEEAIRELATPTPSTPFNGLRMEDNRMPIPEPEGEPCKAPCKVP